MEDADSEIVVVVSGHLQSEVAILQFGLAILQVQRHL